MRSIILGLLACVLLGSVGAVQAERVPAPYAYFPGEESAAGGQLALGTFKAGERACAIVLGDKVQKIVVTDSQHNVVARDDGGGPLLALIWYPTREETYMLTWTAAEGTTTKIYCAVK